jgi:hypothetical protein
MTVAQAQEGDTSALQEGLREVGDTLGAELEAIRNIEWGDLIDWPSLIGDLLRIVFIILLALVTYRVLKVFTRRL